MRALYLLGLGFFCAVGFGTSPRETEIEEEIRGEVIFGADAGAVDKAKRSFGEICEQWRETVRTTVGSPLVYADCGGRVDGTLRCSYTSYVDIGGTIYPETKYSSPYGAQSRAAGKILVLSDKRIRTFEREVRGDRHVCTLHASGECHRARTAAERSFAENCEAWKTDARQSFGSRFLYASCGTASNFVGEIDHGRYGFGLGSRGTVYYFID